MPATLDLPIDTRKPRVYEDGDFVVVEDVPVFKEHVRDGIEFDSDALEQICERCNFRIDNTGDYAPIVIRHNSDGGDSDREVVGFAGPYKLGKIGNRQPKAAILARFRFYKKDYERTRKYPRQSVEYWASEKHPTDGYFDPISLLGSETPELDLGLRYTKRNGRGVRRFCYQAEMPMSTAPAGANTYVPGTDDDDQANQSTSYEKQEPSMGGSLSHEDIAQIVAAMDAVIDAKLDERMASLNKSEGDEDISAAVAEEESAGGMEEGDGEISPDVGVDGQVDADEPDPMTDDAAGDADDDDAGPADDVVAEDDEPTKYDADSDAGGDNSNDEDDAMPDDKATVAKYQKENSDLRLKYKKSEEDRQKLAKENGELKSQIESAEAEKRQAIRYQKLRELEAEGFSFDADEEIKEVASLTDEQFNKHVERISKHYAKIPLAGNKVAKTPVEKNPGEDEMQKRTRYSKEARSRVERSRREGEEIAFEDALADVYKEAGEAMPV